MPGSILFLLLVTLPSVLEAQVGPKIHTVLPIDAISAVFDPKFLAADEAEVHDDSPMIGVSIGGEQHAYSMVLLNTHEIVNDDVGGQAIASTW